MSNKLNRYALAIDTSTLADRFCAALGFGKRLQERRHEGVIVFVNSNGRLDETLQQESERTYQSNTIASTLSVEFNFRSVMFIEETSAANAVQRMFMAWKIDNGQKEALEALAKVMAQNMVTPKNTPQPRP